MTTMQASTQATLQAAKQVTTMPVNVQASQAAPHWGMVPTQPARQARPATRRVRAVIAVWVALLLPLFNDLAGKQLVLASFMQPSTWAVLVGFTTLVGLIAGSYPALFLASFKPVLVLKGQSASGARGAGFRSGLVVFQFVASLILILCTLIVYTQMRYIQDKD